MSLLRSHYNQQSQKMKDGSPHQKHLKCTYYTLLMQVLLIFSFSSLILLAQNFKLISSHYIYAFHYKFSPFLNGFFNENRCSLITITTALIEQCFSNTFPFILGSTAGDTSIDSLYLDSSYNMYFGGSSSDPSISGSSSPKAFFGLLTYGGYLNYLYAITGSYSSVIYIDYQPTIKCLSLILDSSPITFIIWNPSDGSQKSYTYNSGTSSSLLLGDGLYFSSGQIINMAMQTSSNNWLVSRLNSSSGMLYDLYSSDSNSRAYAFSTPWDDTSVIVGGFMHDTSSTSYSSLTILNLNTGAQNNNSLHYGFNSGSSAYVRKVTDQGNCLVGCTETPGGGLTFFSIPFFSNKTLSSDIQQVSYNTNSPNFCISLTANSGVSVSAFISQSNAIIYATINISSGSASFKTINTMQSGSKIVTGINTNIYGTNTLYYTGSTKSVSDGTLSNSYGKQQGFIMMDDKDNSCFTFTYASASISLPTIPATSVNFSQPLTKTTVSGGFSQSSIKVGSTNYSDPNYQQTWCHPKFTYTMNLTAIPDIYCYANRTIDLTNPSPVVKHGGTQPTCSDLDQLTYTVSSSDLSAYIDQSYAKIVADTGMQKFNCNNFNKVVTAIGSVQLMLQVTSDTWLYAKTPFKIIFENKCTDSVSMVTDNLKKYHMYIVTNSAYNYSIPYFSIENYDDPLYCFVRWVSITVTPPCVNITYDSYSKSIAVATSDYSQVGIYFINVTQTLNIQDYVFASNFTIQIFDNCDSSTISTSAITDQVYDINQYILLSLANASWTHSISVCETKNPIVYTYSVSPPTSIINLVNSSTKNVTIYTTDVNDVMVYSVTINATTYNNSEPTQAFAHQSLTFSVNVTNQCPNMSITIPTIANQSYIIGATPLSFSFSDWIPEHTFCFSASYNASFVNGSELTQTDAIQFYNTSRTFEVGTLDVLIAGDYLITIFGIFPNGSAGNLTFFIILTDPCPTVTLNVNSQALQTYTLQNNWTLINGNVFSSSVNETICGNFTYLYEFDDALIPYQNSTNSSSSFLFMSLNNTLPSPTPYTINVTFFQGGYGPVKNLSSSFTLLIIDPCRSITLAGPTINDNIYSISDPYLTFLFSPFNSSLDICGNFSYLTTYQNGSNYDNLTILIDYDERNISVTTMDPSKVGIYPIMINASLPSGYGTIIVNFTITIQCLNKYISGNTTSGTDYVYIIGSPPLKIVFGSFIQYPQCGFKFTYQIIPGKGDRVFPLGAKVLPSSTFTFYSETQTLKVYQSGQTDLGVYNIAVNGSLNDANTTWAILYIFTVYVITEPPTFVSPLKTVNVIAGAQNQYYGLPPAFNVFGEPAIITFLSGNAKFVSYDSSSRQFQFKTKEPEDVGSYTISVMTVDPVLSTLYTRYDLNIQVTVQIVNKTSNATNSTNASSQAASGNENLSENGDGDESSLEAQLRAIEEQQKKQKQLLFNLQHPLSASIKQISKQSVVTVEFTLIMIVPQNYSSFNSSDLNLTILPSADSDPTQLGFNWTIQSIQDQEMTILLDFENPLQISKYRTDKLQITFIQVAKFMSTLNSTLIANFTISKNLPTQMKNDCKFPDQSFSYGWGPRCDQWTSLGIDEHTCLVEYLSQHILVVNYCSKFIGLFLFNMCGG